MTDEAEIITRDRTDNINFLWSDLQILWAQYQSWKKHDRWLTDSQQDLSIVSFNTLKELQSLIGTPNDLVLVGQQLRAALEERLNELSIFNRKSQLSLRQQRKLSEMRTRLTREIMIRSHGSIEHDDDYER